jgi:thioredoxin 2
MSAPSDPSSIVACPACGRRNRVPIVGAGVVRCASCHQHLPWLTDADDTNFDEVTAGPLPALVDLWAPWCGPCRMVAPAVEEITRRFAGRLKTVKVNVDDAPGTARRLGVQGVPTLLIIRGSHVVGRQVGALPAPALEQWVAGQLEIGET